MPEDDAPTLPILETPRLRLRPLKASDLDVFEEIFTDRETLAYWSGDPVPDRAAAKGILERELEWVAKGQALTWAPALRETDEAIGKVTLFHHDKVNRRAELGYIIARR
ncbi:MAG: GNAT family N-acetyltransferase, partial [Myxococcota bacterium]